MPLFEKLDLTEEQKESWLSLREEHRQSMQEHRSMHTYRDSIRIELKNDEPRRERLEDLSTKAGEKYSAHTLKMAEYLLELKEILTPEQYEQLLERQGRSPHRGNNRTHRRNH
jgi:Spy/CpxP family protein refolding chaperone